MSQRKATTLMIVGIVGFSALFVGAFMVPGHRRLTAKQDQVVAGSNEVRDLQQDLGSVSDLYAAIVDLESQLKADRRRLPNDRSVGDFLSDLADALSQCDVADYVVQPLPVLEVNPDAVPDSHAVAARTRVIPFKVEFDGTFAQTFEMMGRIEAFRRSTHVAGLRIANDKNQLGRLRVEMELHTYQYDG